MSSHRYSTGNAPKMLFKIYFNVLTLSILCQLGDAAADIPRVIPLRGHKCSQTCHSESCGDEALRLAKLIDDKIDPCDNFYEFACGSFIKNAVSEDGADVTVMMNGQNDLSLKTNTEVTADIENTDLESFKKTKIFYKNCLDEDGIERAGSRPLLQILQTIGGWPVLLGNRWNERGYNWIEAVSRMKQPKMMDYYFPVSVAIKPDNEDSSRNAIKLSGVKLIIGPSYFVEGQGSTFLQAYLNNMINVAVALGARNDSTTAREMQQVLDFEVNLYKLGTPQEQLDNMPEEKTSIAELSSKCPGIPWLQFINRLLSPVYITVDEREKLFVTDMAFTCGVAQLARNTPNRVIANYLAWRVAKASLTYMPQKFIDIDNEFKTVVEGAAAPNMKLSSCLMETMDLFPLTVSSMFIKKYYDNSAAEPIVEIIENLKSSFRNNIEKTAWMDEETRRAALGKIELMNVTVGVAEELMDDRKVDDYYRDLQLKYPGLYLESAIDVTNFLKIQNFKTLRQPAIKVRWTTKQSAALLNAYYVNEQNNIEMPAGTIYAFYKKNVPRYVNYGILGTFAGHEVMHGFDNLGKHFDKYGNQKDWWQPAAEENFKEKARCLIEQYGNFTIPEINMNVNGETTQNENIADNGGYRAAYLAYDEWAKRNNVVEPCLPSLNYTPQQMFWINAASAWCAKKTPQSLQETLTSDEHSPDNARVILVFSNIKEFAKDFNCPVGSRMNPEKRCTMW